MNAKSGSIATTDLRVAVAGGGIAGLTAALALAQRGAVVTVHEQAKALREVGAGLQLSPNAGRVLAALGVDLDPVSVVSQGVILNDQWGRRVASLPFGRGRDGVPFRLIHRGALLATLARAAVAAGVTIRTGLRLTEPEGDLTLGADGLHSVFRQRLNGTVAPFFTGQTAWRALIPDAAGDPVAQVFMGPRRHLVSYPLAHGKRNLVAVLERPDWQAEGWSHPDDPSNLRAAFADFGGPVPDWLARVEDVHVWGLFRHPVAPRWHDDRTVLLGDAAHPTLPFMAQGAAMAIEDAWVLAACVEAGQGLAAYQALRAPRCTAIVEAANANARNYHLRGPARLVGHTAIRTMARLAPARLTGRFAWIYDHDPTAEVPSAASP